MPVRFLYIPIEDASETSGPLEMLGEYLDNGAELIACNADRSGDGEVYAFNILIYEPQYKLTDLARAALEDSDAGPESTVTPAIPNLPDDLPF